MRSLVPLVPPPVDDLPLDPRGVGKVREAEAHVQLRVPGVTLVEAVAGGHDDPGVDEAPPAELREAGAVVVPEPREEGVLAFVLDEGAPDHLVALLDANDAEAAVPVLGPVDPPDRLVDP